MHVQIKCWKGSKDDRFNNLTEVQTQERATDRVL